MGKEKYERLKDEARQKAIQWQFETSGKNMSYGEFATAQEHLQRLARKYGLTKEFRENGII